jgi:hypothetical protein
MIVDMETLSRGSASPCVSIYVSFSGRGRSDPADTIRFKNALKEAEKQLPEQDLNQMSSIFAPAWRLLDDRRFWRDAQRGLALFLAPSFVEHVWLPRAVGELVFVGERFHLSPLIPLLSDDGVFTILALSYGQVRLLEASRYQQEEITLDEEELLGFVPSRELNDNRSALRQHTRSTGRERMGPPKSFHGLNGEDRTPENEPFLRAVDRAVRDSLGSTTTPLIVAASDRMITEFSSISQHRALVEGGLPGNPEGVRNETLRERAWPLVQPILHQRQAQLLERLRALQDTDRVLIDIRKLIPAAISGEIDVLFLSSTRPRWGRYDRAANALELHEERREGDEDLIDLIVTESFAHGATVHGVDSNALGDHDLSALVRYPHPL